MIQFQSWNYNPNIPFNCRMVEKVYCVLRYPYSSDRTYSDKMMESADSSVGNYTGELRLNSGWHWRIISPFLKYLSVWRHLLKQLVRRLISCYLKVIFNYSWGLASLVLLYMYFGWIHSWICWWFCLHARTFPIIFGGDFCTVKHFLSK